MSTRTKGILFFILIAFGLAWLLWEIPLRSGVPVSSPLFQFFLLPGAFAPALATIIVRKWVTHEGFADAGLRPHFRESWRYYVIALLLPLAVTAVITLLAMATGLGEPDFTFRRAVAQLAPGQEIPPVPPATLLLVPLQLLVTSIFAAPVLWGEEFGWRGYLQIRLLAERPLLAAIATGVIWGVWHYPINLRGYNFPDHPILGLIVFPVSTTLVSVIFGWLMLKSKSVWVASLAHAATNSVGGSLLFLLFAGGADFLYVSYLGILGWLPLGIICLWLVLTGRLKPGPDEIQTTGTAHEQ